MLADVTPVYPSLAPSTLTNPLLALLVQAGSGSAEILELECLLVFLLPQQSLLSRLCNVTWP